MSPVLVAILAALVNVLGPLLLDWLKSLFTKAEANVGSNTDDIFAEAIRLTRGKPFRRALVRALHPMASKIEAGGRLSAGDKSELTALAGKAKSE